MAARLPSHEDSPPLEVPRSAPDSSPPEHVSTVVARVLSAEPIRSRMTPTHVGERVAAVRAYAARPTADPIYSDVLERELWLEVLQAIATGAHRPSELAAIAILTAEGR